jgi:colicin import membrane protein
MFASSLSKSPCRQGWRFAIICIAFSAGSIRAHAQNEPENALSNSASAEQIERQRIAQERSSLNAQLEQQRQACYQKLAVNACLNEARDQHNEKMRDLKRQEVSLNDAQRKRAGADRLRAIDERNSPEAQLKQAQQRGKALENSAQREQQRQERETSRQAKRTTATPEPTLQATETPANITKPEPKPAIASQVPQLATTKPAKPAPDAANAERKRQQATQREKEAQERRARMQEREANRKKPLSAPLPTPAS